MIRTIGFSIAALSMLTLCISYSHSQEKQPVSQVASEPAPQSAPNNPFETCAIWFCAIDPFWEDGEGLVLYIAYDWDETGPFCTPGQMCYMFGHNMTPCPDFCEDGCDSDTWGDPRRRLASLPKGPIKAGQPRLVNSPKEGWDKWVLHPHSDNPALTRNLPSMLRADVGFRGTIWKPRAKDATGKPAFQVKSAQKVIIETPDRKSIPVSLYDAKVDHTITGNPYRMPDGSAIISAQYGVERLPDGEGHVIKDPKDIEVLNDHSMIVDYQGVKYFVVTKSVTQDSAPTPTPTPVP